MAQKYKVQNTGQDNSKRPKTVFGLMILLLIVSSTTFFYTRSKSTSKTTPETTTKDTSVNLSPPTKEEEKETEVFKDNLEKSPEAKITTEDGKKQVTPVITGADVTEVNGYIPGVLEEGGICQAKFTKESQTLEFTSKGFGNVSYTTCEPIAVSGLSVGTWSVTLSYSSSTSSGTSQTSTTEIK